MPTEEAKLIHVLTALFAAGDVLLREESIYTLGYPAMCGYRLTVNSAVTLDGDHARAVRDAFGVAIDDAWVEETD